ncbi:ribonuclease H-like domain-containing protein [Salsuginibacillus kocurii]|uniref:ribonuclease H-like domain-containing protein n=1 Tax=Salsuginibacillus kocurii TaxID=427078 RepID=UPI00037D9ECC|nr:ribonuclease H-like domain-containing protein [Salsuginibacillus kocurii]
MKEKLNRLKKHMIRADEPAREPEQPVDVSLSIEKEAQTEQEKWSSSAMEICWFEDMYIYKRKQTYSLPSIFNKKETNELKEIVNEWAASTITNHPLTPDGDTSETDLLFFDTETTGLQGGAGTTIFLLGAAEVKGDQVVVTQWLLPGPEHEVAFYYHFLTDIGTDRKLVTFNGKSFDWPQVKTRHTFVKDNVPKLPAFGHFDLLHAARRLFKDRLPSCKLSVIENDILGVHREDDVPGYLAPMLYFDYLKSGDLSYVEGILEHNEQDVLSLILLYIDISRRVITRGRDETETGAIAKWHEANRDFRSALSCYEKITSPATSELMFRKACLYKKCGNTEQALPLFAEVYRRSESYAYQAGIEYAKQLEHKVKDYISAYNVCLHLKDSCPSAEWGELDKRTKRLREKIEKSEMNIS